MATLLVKVASVRGCHREGRTERVNQLLDLDTTKDTAAQLQANALLIAALREQGIWPQGCS